MSRRFQIRFATYFRLSYNPIRNSSRIRMEANWLAAGSLPRILGVEELDDLTAAIKRGTRTFLNIIPYRKRQKPPTGGR